MKRIGKALRRAEELLAGEWGDALLTLLFIVVFGWIGVIQDPRDRFELWVGQVCWIVVTGHALYAAWRAVLAGREQ